MKFHKILVFYTIFALLFATKFACAQEDDDDELAEIIGDILIGAAVAVCEANGTCAAFMSMCTIIFIIIGILGCICDGCVDYSAGLESSNISYGRAMRIAGGYGGTRILLRH